MWEYLTLFVLAATPWIELLVVIPLGIGYGLPPLPVALVTFLGNVLPIVGIVLLYERWLEWRGWRAESPAAAEDAVAGRKGRARRLWSRYGLPGLALLAPLVTGVHLATVVALALGSPRRRTALWMIAAIALWTAGLTVVSYYGVEEIRRWAR